MLYATDALSFPHDLRPFLRRNILNNGLKEKSPARWYPPGKGNTNPEEKDDRAAMNGRFS